MRTLYDDVIGRGFFSPPFTYVTFIVWPYSQHYKWLGRKRVKDKNESNTTAVLLFLCLNGSAGPKTERKKCKYLCLQPSDGGSISIYEKKQLFLALNLSSSGQIRVGFLFTTEEQKKKIGL